MNDRRVADKKHLRTLRFGLRFVLVAAFLVLAESCSNWVMGVVQSFGTANGAKISTAVGSGTGGSAGDGGPATSAEIHFPYGVAVDSSGNLYIADSTNCVIRKVDSSGRIITVAGSSSQAGNWSGDNGPATSAGLNGPLAVALDSSGNMYIADAGNNVIRKVDTTGTITTVAGSYGNSVYNGDTGVGTSIFLGYPYGLAVDSARNLYIADNYDCLIRKLDTIGNISTVAGSHIRGAGYNGDGRLATTAELNYPLGVAVDASGNIYIADSSNYLIRKVDHITQYISSVAGTGVSGYSGDGGPATAAEINYPADVTVDSAGNLYISEGDNIVRKVDTSGNISTVAGNTHLGAGYGGDGNVATAALLNNPWGLAFDSFGNLLIADRLNNRIREVGFGK